jgi:hypothetical protein
MGKVEKTVSATIESKAPATYRMHISAQAGQSIRRNAATCLRLGVKAQFIQLENKCFIFRTALGVIPGGIIKTE